MSPMLRLSLLLPAAMAVAAPAARPQERKAVSAAYVESVNVMSRLEPLLKELDALRAVELEAADPAPMAPVREHLLGEISPLMSRLMTAQREFLRHNRSHLLIESAEILTLRKPPTDRDSGVVDIAEGTEMAERISDFKVKAWRVVVAEESAHQVLMARTDQQREDRETLWFLLTTGSVVVVIMAAACLYRLKRA
jgi:hypothetical protein